MVDALAHLPKDVVLRVLADSCRKDDRRVEFHGRAEQHFLAQTTSNPSVVHISRLFSTTPCDIGHPPTKTTSLNHCSQPKLPPQLQLQHLDTVFSQDFAESGHVHRLLLQDPKELLKLTNCWRSGPQNMTTPGTSRENTFDRADSNDNSETFEKSSHMYSTTACGNQEKQPMFSAPRFQGKIQAHIRQVLVGKLWVRSLSLCNMGSRPQSSAISF